MNDLMHAPESLIRAGKALIKYPRFKELQKEILRCQQMSKVLGEPQCMSLEGETGTGKTTLVKTHFLKYPRTETEYGTKIPIFYLSVPSPVTIRGLAQTMLMKLGDPAYNKGTRVLMTSRLVGLIKDCEVELVILDEFQHVIDSKTRHILSQVSNWLKTIIKDTGVPFLVVGIKGEVEIILEANPQLSRLFAVRECLEPFQWDWKNVRTRKVFSKFVDYIENAIKIPLSKELPRTEMLYRLHYATDGVIGNMMNLMLGTAVLATERSEKTLSLALLQLTFRNRLAKHLKVK